MALTGYKPHSESSHDSKYQGRIPSQMSQPPPMASWALHQPPIDPILVESSDSSDVGVPSKLLFNPSVFSPVIPHHATNRLTRTLTPSPTLAKACDLPALLPSSPSSFDYEEPASSLFSPDDSRYPSPYLSRWNFPFPRARHSVAVIDDIVFIFGGSVGPCDRHNLQSDLWSIQMSETMQEQAYDKPVERLRLDPFSSGTGASRKETESLAKPRDPLGELFLPASIPSNEFTKPSNSTSALPTLRRDYRLLAPEDHDYSLRKESDCSQSISTVSTACHTNHRYSSGHGDHSIDDDEVASQVCARTSSAASYCRRGSDVSVASCPTSIGTRFQGLESSSTVEHHPAYSGKLKFIGPFFKDWSFVPPQRHHPTLYHSPSLQSSSLRSKKISDDLSVTLAPWPTNRGGSTLTADPKSRSLYLFGGYAPEGRIGSPPPELLPNFEDLTTPNAQVLSSVSPLNSVGSPYSDELWKYSIDDGYWKQLGPICPHRGDETFQLEVLWPEGRAGHSAVLHDGKLIIYGGVAKPPHRELLEPPEDLDDVGEIWHGALDQERRALGGRRPIERRRTSLLQALGDHDESEHFGDVWAYSIETNEWEILFDVPESFYFLHEDDCDSGSDKSIYCSDDSSSDNGLPFPCPRTLHTSTVWKSSMIICFGRHNMKECDDLWSFDLVNYRWTKIDLRLCPRVQFDCDKTRKRPATGPRKPLPHHGRYWHSSTLLGSLLFISGGIQSNSSRLIQPDPVVIDLYSFTLHHVSTSIGSISHRSHSTPYHPDDSQTAPENSSSEHAVDNASSSRSFLQGCDVCGTLESNGGPTINKLALRCHQMVAVAPSTDLGLSSKILIAVGGWMPNHDMKDASEYFSRNANARPPPISDSPSSSSSPINFYPLGHHHFPGISVIEYESPVKRALKESAQTYMRFHRHVPRRQGARSYGGRMQCPLRYHVSSLKPIDPDKTSLTSESLSTSSDLLPEEEKEVRKFGFGDLVRLLFTDECISLGLNILSWL